VGGIVSHAQLQCPVCGGGRCAVQRTRSHVTDAYKEINECDHCSSHIWDRAPRFGCQIDKPGAQRDEIQYAGHWVAAPGEIRGPSPALVHRDNVIIIYCLIRYWVRVHGKATIVDGNDGEPLIVEIIVRYCIVIVSVPDHSGSSYRIPIVPRTTVLLLMVALRFSRCVSCVAVM
jgi:hypothetical protein